MTYVYQGVFFPILRVVLAGWLIVAPLSGTAFAGAFADKASATARGEDAEKEPDNFFDRFDGVRDSSPETVRKAAEQGDPDAQYKLGLLYDKGLVVLQDFAEAVKWYRKAAEQGHADAQNNLGFFYSKGWAVPQDDVQAHKWWNLAAASGSRRAANNRDDIARKMTWTQIAEAQKMAREWKKK